jgi:FAD-linked sulfhydryl oxidase
MKMHFYSGLISENTTMPPTWGPTFWGALHMAALALPLELDTSQQEGFKSFVTSYTRILPCGECRIHWGEVLEEKPIDPHLQRGEEVFNWTVDAHNYVNLRTGKPLVSYEEATNYWISKMGTDDRLEDIKTIIIALILIIIIALFLYR